MGKAANLPIKVYPKLARLINCTIIPLSCLEHSATESLAPSKLDTPAPTGCCLIHSQTLRPDPRTCKSNAQKPWHPVREDGGAPPPAGTRRSTARESTGMATTVPLPGFGGCTSPAPLGGLPMPVWSWGVHSGAMQPCFWMPIGIGNAAIR
jgi:hypothetical protein